jgi:hypothetical protein
MTTRITAVRTHFRCPACGYRSNRVPRVYDGPGAGTFFSPTYSCENCRVYLKARLDGLRGAFTATLEGVDSNRAVLALDVEAPPATFSHLVAPGVYRLELRIAGSYSAPVSKVLEINVTGNWFPDQKQMFSDGLGIRVLA